MTEKEIHLKLSDVVIDNDNLDYIKATGEICGKLREDLVKLFAIPAVSNRLLLDVYSTISDMQQEMWDTENHFKDETYKKIQKVKEEIKTILNGC